MGSQKHWDRERRTHSPSPAEFNDGHSLDEPNTRPQAFGPQTRTAFEQALIPEQRPQTPDGLDIITVRGLGKVVIPKVLVNNVLVNTPMLGNRERVFAAGSTFGPEGIITPEEQKRREDADNI